MEAMGQQVTKAATEAASQAAARAAANEIQNQLFKRKWYDIQRKTIAFLLTYDKK